MLLELFMQGLFYLVFNIYRYQIHMNVPMGNPLIPKKGQGPLAKSAGRQGIDLYIMLFVRAIHGGIFHIIEH
jgi:hypothetical protein